MSVSLVVVALLSALRAALPPAAAIAQDLDRKASPDGTRYVAVTDGYGEHRGGRYSARLETFTREGRRIAVAWMLVEERDGVGRLNVRGCEAWGWVDDARVFCEGTINPSVSVHRVFDARTGQELREAGGAHFVWSPDGRTLANHGPIGHGDYGKSSDYLEVDNTEVYRVTDTLWFRSAPVWSPDSQRVAVVAHRQVSNSLWLAVVSPRGRATTYQLPWDVAPVEWPPAVDVAITWDGPRVTVRHSGREHTFDTGRR